MAPSRGTPWTRHSSPSLASETWRAACSACRWGLTCVSGRSAGCARGRRTRRRRRRHRLLREAEPAAAGKRVQWKRDSASMLGRDTRQCSSQRGIRVTGHRLPSTKLPDGPGEGHGSSPDPCPGRAPALHEANFFIHSINIGGDIALGAVVAAEIFCFVPSLKPQFFRLRKRGGDQGAAAGPV